MCMRSHSRRPPCMRPSFGALPAVLLLVCLLGAGCRARPTPAPLEGDPCAHGEEKPSGPPRVEVDPEPPDSLGRLRGRVWDHTEEWRNVGIGRPIAGAWIVVHQVGDTARRILATATSDDSGRFTLSAPLPEGRHELVTRRISFSSRADTIVVPMVPGHRLRVELVAASLAHVSCRVIRTGAR